MSAERFGPYELVRLIGRGGMGEVFEAYDTEQDRTVALKRLVPHMIHDQEFQHRFRRESRLAARLRSPHVVPIHRSGEIEGQLFIDMRLVEGCDLEQLLVAETRMSPPHAVAVIEQVGWALDDAHHAGLIHRDIKPSNVLLDHTVEGHEFAYLADFGITRAVGSESVSLTSTHAVLGSLDYMAPEQFDGIASTEADIYSLGCLLFQCLTGSKPFPVEGFPALMRAHLSKSPPLVSQSQPGLGDRFDEVVACALAKDPAERYPSAGALATAARSALTAVEMQRLEIGDHARRLVDSGGDRAGWSAASIAASGRSGKAVLGEDRELAAAIPTQAARGDTEVGHEPAGVDGDAPPGVQAEAPVSGRGGAGLLTAAKAATVSKPRRDHPAERAPAAPGALPETEPSSDGPPSATAAPVPPAPPQSANEPGPSASGVGPSAAQPPEPPPPSSSSSITDGAPEPGQPAPWWSRRGLVIALGVVVLVVLLGLGALVGKTVLGGWSSPGTVVGVAGQGAVPLPPPAPTLRSSDAPSVLSTFSVGNGPEAIAVSPDGARAYITGESGANVLNVTDTARGTVLATVPAPGPPQFIVMDPSGSHGYVTLWDQSKNQNAVAVFDVPRNVFTAIIPTGEQRPFGLGISPDGAKLYVPNHDSGQITVIDTATQTVTAQIQVPPNPHWIAFNPTGRIAYAANHMAGVVTVLDTQTNSVIGVIPIGNMVSPHSIAVTPDGRRAEVTNYDGNSVSTIDTATNQVLRTVPVGVNPQSVVFARDSAHSYVVNNASNNLSVLNTDTGAVTATIPLGTSPWMAAVSPDGRFAYVTNKETNSVTVLDIAH